MKIKVFSKSGCAKCETTKHKIKHFLVKWELEHKVAVDVHDMETIEGMAEGAFHDVSQIPTTIIEKENTEVARWEGEVPQSDRIKDLLAA